MRGKIAILISLLVIVSFISGCTTSEVFVNNNEFYGCIQEPVIMDDEVQSGLNQLYGQYLAECRQECSTCNCEVESKIYIALNLEEGWEPGLFGKEVTLPFTYNIKRCLPSQHYRLNNADLGLDTTKCPEEFQILRFEDDTTMSIFSLPFTSLILYVPVFTDNYGCSPTSFRNRNLPPTINCQLKESYLLVINSESPNLIINGNQINPIDNNGNFVYIIYYYSGWDKSLIDKFLQEFNGPFSNISSVHTYNDIPSSINITYDEWEGQPTTDVFLYRECCWDCNSKPQLPATILYPKVDIESFTLNNGDAIIKDGKVVSSFTIAPGVQKPIIGVENRGFFTQNHVYIKFVGLPDGIEVITTPELQKIKAHNIGTV
ncbi:MAG TPA: hypothetical protein PLI06_08530 [Methanofastidiosum sp.]|nr:hypothetical protein [Methanofastidiosum sp.]